MSFNYQTVGGGQAFTIALTNDDVNASWQTVSANTLTSSGSVFANGTVDLLALIQTKQDELDGTTDLTVRNLTSNTITNATTLTTASMSATGNISTTVGDITTSSGSITASGNITSSSGSLIGDNIAIDNDLIVSDSGSHLLSFGTPQVGSNGFRIKELYLNNVNGFINEPGVCLGESEGGHLDGGDYGMMICCDTSVQTGRNGYIGFADVNTANKRGLIDYDFANDRLDLYANGTGGHKISIRSSVIDFSEQIRGNNGLYLQGSNGITVVSGGDIVNSSGNIRATTGDIYAETGNMAVGKAPDGTAPLDVVGNIEASGTINCDTLTCSNLTIDSDVLHVDSTNDRLGINTATPESSLHVVGAREGVPTSVGVHVGHSSGTNYGLELCSDATASSGIDFTKPSSNRRGSIGYNNSTEVMSFTVNNGVQLTLANLDADFQDNNLTTTGNIQCADATMTGDLTVDTDTFHVDSTLNGVSVGASLSTNTPQCALSVYGPFTTDTPTERGIHMSLKDDAIALMQMCSGGGALHPCLIEFTQPGSDYKGRIGYNHTSNDLNFEVENADVLNLTTTTADFQGLAITTTGNATVNDLTVNGTLTGFSPSLQDIYDNNDVEPHITIAASHPVTFQGHASVTNTFQCRDAGGTNVFEVARDGHMTCVDADINGELTVIGDLTVDTNTFYVDSTNNGVSVGTNVLTNTPQCALSVYGSYTTDSPSEKGIHMSLKTNDTPIIQLCSDSESAGKIEFTEPGSDYKGLINYNHSDNGMQFHVENTLLMDLTTSQTMVYGDLTVDTNTFHVDSTNNHVGVGTTSPESALQIVGARQGVPTTAGVHIGHSSGTNYGMELCSDATASSGIDFTKPSSNRRGAIGYNNSTEVMSFTVNNGVQLTLNTTTADFQDNNIITTGTIDANLNSTRGQLLTYMGEESGRLNVNAYDFNYGNGRNSDSRFGMITGVQSLKLKRFTYAGESGGSYTTSTRIVFQLYIDNTAQSVYMYCDFSNTTNGSVTNKRFNEKFSSSATSQIDTEPTITKTWGVSLSWRTITLTSYDIACVGHRISVVAETQDNL
jgi:hypothetical protein